MSVAGIASSLFSQIAKSAEHTKPTSAQNEFQQLSQDLQAGNLTQAQSDFAALQQTTLVSSAGGSGAISQAFNALGQDLKSGNLTGAQQDFASIQQDIQQAGQFHRHHHHAEISNSSSASSQSSNSISATLCDSGAGLAIRKPSDGAAGLRLTATGFAVVCSGGSSGVGPVPGQRLFRWARRTNSGKRPSIAIV